MCLNIIYLLRQSLWFLTDISRNKLDFIREYVSQKSIVQWFCTLTLQLINNWVTQNFWEMMLIYVFKVRDNFVFFTSNSELFVGCQLQLCTSHSLLEQIGCYMFVFLLTLTLPGPSAGVSGSLDSYCSFKTLMLGHGRSSAGSYLANPTSPIPSHCAAIVLFQSVAVLQLSWLAL